MDRWAALLADVPAWHIVTMIIALVALFVVLMEKIGPFEVAGMIILLLAVFRLFGGVISLAKKGLQTLRGELS